MLFLMSPSDGNTSTRTKCPFFLVFNNTLKNLIFHRN